MLDSSKIREVRKSAHDTTSVEYQTEMAFSGANCKIRLPQKIREIGFSGLPEVPKYASQALYFGLFGENVESAQSSIKSRTYDDKKITHNAKVVVGY